MFSVDGVEGDLIYVRHADSEIGARGMGKESGVQV